MIFQQGFPPLHGGDVPTSMNNESDVAALLDDVQAMLIHLEQELGRRYCFMAIAFCVEMETGIWFEVVSIGPGRVSE